MAYDPSQFGSTPPEYATSTQLQQMQALSNALMQPRQQTLYAPWQGAANVANALIGGYFGHLADVKQMSKAQGTSGAGMVAPVGGANPSNSAVASAVSGQQNPSIAGGQIDRSRFAAELEANPALRDHILAVSAGENNDPTANLAVLESMMNRAHMMGTSLAQESRLASRGGYYAGYNPSALNNPQTRAMIEQNLKTALSGSNVSNYATDNASEGNTRFASRRFASGMYTPTFSQGGEYFSYPSNTSARGYNRYWNWRNSVGGGQQPQAAAQATGTNASDY